MEIKFFEFINEVKKTIPRKRMYLDIDPFSEEDWGYENINEDDFKDKIAIFRLNSKHLNGYFCAKMLEHNSILCGAFNDIRKLNSLQMYNKLTPINEREKERIMRDKIELLWYGGTPDRNNLGEKIRNRFSNIVRGKGFYFIDQNFIDSYLDIN